WDTPRHRYLFPEFLADISTGHAVQASVVIETEPAWAMYRARGAPEFRSVGQTEFFAGVAAMFASGRYGRSLGCAGIVGFADLRLGARVQAVLDANADAAGGRFRGIRNPLLWHRDKSLRVGRAAAAGIGEDLMQDRMFREGFA